MPDRSRKTTTEAEFAVPKAPVCQDIGITWEEAIRLFKRLESPTKRGLR